MLDNYKGGDVGSRVNLSPSKHGGELTSSASDHIEVQG